jgi:hypothetical protein
VLRIALALLADLLRLLRLMVLSRAQLAAEYGGTEICFVSSDHTWGEERIAAEIFAPVVDEALQSMSLQVLKTPVRARKRMHIVNASSGRSDANVSIG